MQVIYSSCAAQTRWPVDQQRSMGRGLESTGRDRNCVALSPSAVQYVYMEKQNYWAMVAALHLEV